MLKIANTKRKIIVVAVLHNQLSGTTDAFLKKLTKCDISNIDFSKNI